MATISENLQILKNSITSIKQAIINKCGIVEGNITTYADYINSINTNIGDNQSPIPASVSDVNFLDYDGTILYSYTKEQFLALSAMPELPTRDGLICQGWNWDFDEAKEYVTDYGMLNIGAMYITDDGDTRLYIHIATEGRMTVPLYWSQTVNNGVYIDWGDGSDIQSVYGTGSRSATHTYANPGDYVIRLKVADDCTLGLGADSTSFCVMGNTADVGKVYCNMLQKVELGSGVTNIGVGAFSYCYSLSSVVIPNSVTNIGDYAFYYCYSLVSVSIPNSFISIGNNAFRNCYSLASIIMSSSVISINNYAFYYCYSLASVVIPNSVTSIGNYTFYSCKGMAIYDFTNHTSVPTLADTYAFYGIMSDCKIKVPASLLNEWKAATNWSNYASKIIAG